MSRKPKYKEGMVVHPGPGERVADVIIIAILVLCMFIAIVPMWHTVMVSLSDGQLVIAHEGILWKWLTGDGSINLAGYERTIDYSDYAILKSYAITLLYVVGNVVFGLVIGLATMDYVHLSMLFAFASLYGETTILFMMIIPIKARWLGWFNLVLFAISVIRYLSMGAYLMALMPIVALFNYVLFFYSDILAFFGAKKRHVTHKYSKQTIDFHAAQKHAKEKKGYLHKCAVCGRTDVTNPELEFRYCSKCNGYYCYCSDHIDSHVHIE